jgi:Flp pilus assembly protein CpaB
VENIMSSKLFTTRQGTVLLGVIAAVIAAIALIVYLNQYRNSHNGSPAVSVLVAQKLIEKNTPGDVIRTTSGLYRPTSLAKSQVETGAILDPATLAGKVALTDISPGQQLTAADFGPATTNSVINQVGRDQRAVVVPLGSAQQVGGQIAAGSHVDVWTLLTAQSNGVSKPIARELFQNMYVLGVSGGNVTFRATPTQAGTLIYASQNSQLWLVLRPTVASVTKPPVISSNNLAGG